MATDTFTVPNGFRLSATGKSRPFVVTGGLRIGYGDDAKTFTLDDVISAHHKWMMERNKIFGLLLGPASPSYGWPADGEIKTATEPGFTLTGGINVQYDPTMSDSAALEMLIDLATFIAAELQQTRIYLTFQGRDHIFQALDKTTPREE